jgi:isocitrate/isopropylmalate dehydrogenase
VTPAGARIDCERRRCGASVRGVAPRPAAGVARIRDGGVVRGENQVANRRVVVLPGDDEAPQTVYAALEVIRALGTAIEFVEFPPGEQWIRGETDKAARAAIDTSDSTLFGSTSGKTTSINYLRWGKQTFANVRPCRYMPGFKSPLARPDGIDYVIVRENLEDLYLMLEGPLETLAPLHLYSRILRAELDTSELGIFAIKVITEKKSRQIARFACELARKRKAQGYPGKLTCTSKYNMLRESDGFFRQIVEETAAGYPDITYEQFIVDDFARRIVQSSHSLDVVVMPNLYGDILSDAAAGTIGGLGLAPSGCYGDGYAYFESVHGTAPDIKGMGVINPTATMLSAVMMLEYLGFVEESRRFENAIRRVYGDGRTLTVDQGGTAKTAEFTRAVIANL